MFKSFVRIKNIDTAVEKPDSLLFWSHFEYYPINLKQTLSTRPCQGRYWRQTELVRGLRTEIWVHSQHSPNAAKAPTWPPQTAATNKCRPLPPGSEDARLTAGGSTWAQDDKSHVAQYSANALGVYWIPFCPTISMCLWKWNFRKAQIHCVPPV